MMKFTILGCGSSGGVPRIGGDFGACDPQNPKNTRKRCALLVENYDKNGATRAVIDAGQDFRLQMLESQTPMIDAVLLTHEHADHSHGIDDVRQFINIRVAKLIEEAKAKNPNFTMDKPQFNRFVEKSRIDCYAGNSCYDEMLQNFSYLFHRAGENADKLANYPAIMTMKKIEKSFNIKGQGGDLTVEAFSVPHGDILAYGFRFGELVYLPDVYELTEEAENFIADCGVFIVDCLQFHPHGTHTHFEKTMEWIARLKPKRAILTNLHTPMDYENIQRLTPSHVEPAYDGMVIEI